MPRELWVMAALTFAACAKPTSPYPPVDIATWAAPPPSPAQACNPTAQPRPVAEWRTVEPTPLPEEAHPALTEPGLAMATAPEQFWIRFETTAGSFVVEVRRDWSPHGADRLYNLVDIGFYDGGPVFRVIPGFMAQFGMAASAAANQAWKDARIPDDPVRLGNTRGVLTMAQCGAPDCRTTQAYINLVDNRALDPMGFAGVGVVVDGMSAVDALYGCYGESHTMGGRSVDQDRLRDKGIAVVDAGWPDLSRIVSASIVEMPTKGR